MNDKFLSLRDIQNLCARQNGKTSTIVDECVEHLMHGTNTLVVVTYNLKSCDMICKSVYVKLNENNIVVTSGRMNKIRLQYSEVIIVEYEIEDILRNIRGKSVADILFDSPEKVFDSRLIGLMPFISR